MQFQTWAEFWQMGGYGFFVWLSFGVTLVAMVALYIQTRFAAAALKKDAQQNQLRQQRIRQAMEVNSESTS